MENYTMGLPSGKPQPRGHAMSNNLISSPKKLYRKEKRDEGGIYILKKTKRHIKMDKTQLQD